MSKDELKNVKEYQYLKSHIILSVIIIAVWVTAVAFGTIPFWFDNDINKAVLGVILVVGCVVTLLYSPLIIYNGIGIIKIKKGLAKYELVEAIVATSSQLRFGRRGRILQCSANLTKYNVPVDFKVYMNMYENGIELINGSIVSIWYNATNGHALFVSKI